ncbi:hypothetical protein VE04_10141 [Pseudogymnoascus sp. 24MN13]|nr:hypothetical protein VE04_10141 [Pseudogymnoascus sp. 24MN13]
MADHLEKIKNFDSTRHLVLYSGGADSTLFIGLNESSKYLLHYPPLNIMATKIASHNALRLNKHLNIATASSLPKDGELSEVHGLYDVGMLVDAGIYAIRHGFDGIVACFNKDDLGCDFKAIQCILEKYKPGFEIALPLLHIDQRSVLNELKNRDLRFGSAAYSKEAQTLFYNNEEANGMTSLKAIECLQN